MIGEGLCATIFDIEIDGPFREMGIRGPIVALDPYRRRRKSDQDTGSKKTIVVHSVIGCRYAGRSCVMVCRRRDITRELLYARIHKCNRVSPRMNDGDSPMVQEKKTGM